MCYGGVKLDPHRKPCSSIAFITSIFNLKTITIIGLLGTILYYGWPIIEAIISILPIPDAKNSFDNVKSMAGSATGFVSSAMTSQPRQQQFS